MKNLMKLPVRAIVTALSLAIASPALAALNVNDLAPDFSAQGVQGDAPTPLHLSEMLKRGPVVIFLLPYISSGASAAECREFADNIEAFKAAGATVVGMSRDPISDLGRFSAEQCAGKIPMASADLTIITGYNVNDNANFATRTTYVVAPSGDIAFVHDDDDRTAHVSSALAFVQSMKR